MLRIAASITEHRNETAIAIIIALHKANTCYLSFLYFFTINFTAQ